MTKTKETQGDDFQANVEGLDKVSYIAANA